MTYKQLSTKFGNVDAAESARVFISFLDSATRILAESKELVCEMLDIRRGQRVLDVGCGTGDDVRRMAELAGDGFVMGVDSSKAMIAEARKRGPGHGGAVRFAVGDLKGLPISSATFDVCRAERVLQHVDEPLDAVSQMVRVLKPGGRVLVADADYGMAAINAGDRATTSSILGIYQKNLRNPWIGRQLPGLFRACGLSRVDTRILPVPFSDFRVASALVDFEGLTRQAVNERVISSQAASRWLLDLQTRQEKGDFLFVLMGFLVMGQK